MDRYLLKKEDIDVFEGIEKTHFLNANAQRRNKSLGDLTGLTGIGFHIIEVEPGRESTELHQHYHEDECVYVLEGTAQATIGDTVHTVNAGDFIGYRAGGAAHTLLNTGATVLRCIVVGQRSAHDVADYPKLKKRIYRHQGMPWNLVDYADIAAPSGGKKV